MLIVQLRLVKSKLLKLPVSATVSVAVAPIMTPLEPVVATLKPAATASDIAPVSKVLVPTAPAYVLLT